MSDDTIGGSTSHLLDVRNLRTHFLTEAGVVKAVDGIDFHVDKGEILGLVGESGCGKSATALSIMRLIPSGRGEMVSGEVYYEGRDLLRLSEREMCGVRGNSISMVFQEPMVSLNPVHTIMKQIGEMFVVHRPDIRRRDIPERVVASLQEVRISAPAETARRYPHQMSGGMLQRAMIAMSLACGKTRLLIADEPTTALDVTVQAQILELLKRLQEEHGMSVILITHDLAVVAETVDRVIVMYAGSIIETAGVAALFAHPRHPYTQGLLESLPQVGRKKRKDLLYTIPGVVPNPLDLQPGCKFMNRCRYAKPDVCGGREPDLVEVESGHHVRCARVHEL